MHASILAALPDSIGSKLCPVSVGSKQRLTGVHGGDTLRLCTLSCSVPKTAWLVYVMNVFCAGVSYSAADNDRQQSHASASTSTPSLQQSPHASNGTSLQQPQVPQGRKRHHASVPENIRGPMSTDFNGQELQQPILANSLTQHRASSAQALQQPASANGQTQCGEAQKAGHLPVSASHEAFLTQALPQPIVANGSAQHGQGDAVGPLPMLASACPGWVCYAEKTHGSYILPYISTAKSPQAGSSHLLIVCQAKSP